MIVRSLWPLWAIGLVLVPLVIFCLVQVFRHPSRRLDWIRRSVIALAILGLAVGPSVEDRDGTTLQTNAEIFFVVDRTGSMGAEDYNGTQRRLAGVEHDLSAIVDAFPAARYSIIGWDSQATRQLPLTTDARAVKSWAQTARQEITSFSSGSQVDRPLLALTEALTGAAERNPNNVRIVYFLSDGENTDGSNSSTTSEMASYAGLAPLIDGGGVLGYGTTEGGRMRINDGYTPLDEAEYIQDPTTGTDALSVIDEINLRTIAEQLGVDYTHRITPDAVDALVAGIDVDQIAGDGRRDQVTYRPVMWPFAIVITLGLIWELFVITRSFPTRLGPDGFAPGRAYRTRSAAASASTNREVSR